MVFSRCPKVALTNLAAVEAGGHQPNERRRRLKRSLRWVWPWVIACASILGCGTPMYHRIWCCQNRVLGVSEFTTHSRTYFSGDWDVHTGYDLDSDSWPGGCELLGLWAWKKPHSFHQVVASSRQILRCWAWKVPHFRQVEGPLSRRTPDFPAGHLIGSFDDPPDAVIVELLTQHWAQETSVH